jgi:hypothetical protein
VRELAPVVVAAALLAAQPVELAPVVVAAVAA